LVSWLGAAAATFAFTMMGGYEDPPLNASERVHDGAVGAEHVQPKPAIPTKLRAEGKISVTVTVPLVDAAPEPLLTVTVYVAPAWPIVNAPPCAL
jgi:hypothetical protein